MEPIAVIGIGCRLPQARNIGSLWELLCSGRDALSAVPDGRYPDLDDPLFSQSDSGRRLRALRGGFLEGIELFDPGAFNISPREARVIDPQQRLLLETTWEALEDAGEDIHRLAGTSVGVYAGVWKCDYQARLFRQFPHIDIAMTTGGSRHAAAGRLSYAFGFQGPSVSVDTACSSSLVAVHLACQALRAGECTLAIAGGANVILDSAVTIAYMAAGALSPEGRCKFGDASADGYVRSEGVGVVVLKTLRKALVDRDTIHAIIRGSAVTHNGQTGGSLLAPGAEGQLRLLRQAFAAAALRPADLSYIEAHGTGTRVGDLMELRALGKLLCEDRTPSSSPCLVGSIKTNIGHTESAAGIAGLIKAILCLKHREIPASLHFRQPNPEVPWNELPLKIVTRLIPLPSRGRPAFAGVNSFGITGTFAHVILEEAGPAESQLSAPVNHRDMTVAPASMPVLLPLSACSHAALAQLAGAFAGQIRRSPGNLSSVAFSAALRRTHHEVRLAVIGSDPLSLSGALETFARGETAAGVCARSEPLLTEPRIGWVFSGQGPQWPAMGRQLFDTEPVFRTALERLEPLIEAQAGWSLLTELNAPAGASRLEVTAIAQPAIFSLQLALAELLKSWALPPAMVVGHSVGEAAAACVAGILELEDAVRVICARARIAEQARGLGKMAAVELDVDEARELISEVGDKLSLAAVNGPRSLTVSGAIGPLQAFCRQVAARGRFCRVLDLDYPFHSALLEPLLAEMSTVGRDLSMRTPHTPLYSTVYGRLATVTDFTPAYWPRNLRQTVQFAPAIEQMVAHGCNLFVEISPHPVLSYSIRQVLYSLGTPGCVIETLHRQGDEAADMRRTVGRQYVQGCNPHWPALVPTGAATVSLPSYPWHREPYWIDEKSLPRVSARRKAGGTGLLDPLLQRSLRAMGTTGAYYWESDIDYERFPWIAEHRVQGRTVFPAAAYLLPALKAAGQFLPGAVLAGVEIREALFVPPGAALSLQFRFQRSDDGAFDLAIYAGDPVRPELARLHVTGRVLPSAGPLASTVLCPANFAGNGSTPAGRDAVYQAMHRCRLDYGPAFRAIETLRLGTGEALARLTITPAIQAEADEYGIHPATFDACLQTLVSLTPHWSHAGELWMPRAVDHVSLRKLPAADAALWAWATVHASCDLSAKEIVGDVSLLDNEGEVLVTARGVHLQKVSSTVDFSSWMHEVRWQARALPEAPQANEDCFMPPLAGLENRMLAVESSPAEQKSIRAALADLNRIGGVSVQQAFTDLGFVFTPGRRVTLDEVAAETGIAPRYRRLLTRLQHILSEDGILNPEGDQWQVQRVPAREDLAAQLRTAAPTDPGLAPLWKIFGRASLNLAAILTGRLSAVELLFGGDDAVVLEQLYATAAFWRRSMRQLVEAVSAIAGRLPEGRALRLLEIGAGTGGLTAQLLPLLPPDRTEYIFTDLSSYFLTRAREKFATYPFLTTRILDVERDPVSQGFASGRFDVVLAANCLHATHNLRQSLGHAKQLLAPGGYLLLQEETSAERWTDLIFGLTDGWWRFDDCDLRTEHPLLSPELWLQSLREQGFPEAVVVGGRAVDACGSAVVVARNSVSIAPCREPWLLLAGTGDAAQQLGNRLAALGQNCQMVWTAAALSAWLAAGDIPGRTVIDLRPLDATLTEMDDASSLAAVAERSVTDLLQAVHILTDCDHVHLPRLVLVTRGSQATGTESVPVALAQAPLWAVARIAALEHPRLPVMRIDLDPEPVDTEITALAAELLANDAEPDIAFREARRLVPRLHRLDVPDSCPFALKVVNRGSLDGLEAQPATRRTPAPGEVQIRVAAAGMNLRDVLNMLGAVESIPLGLECSGRITSVGAGVTGFRVGDEVLAAGLGSWCTYFNTPASLVTVKPSKLSHPQAAALPIAYLTAHYALRHVARIQPGQRVLIHSAAGGVGLAAVHLALAAGAEVFGTAGSPAKRAYLRSLGVPHVFDSRTLDFAAEIRTIGPGVVDVVLNCFIGEFIPKSLHLLVPGGHFVEIGKRDIWTSSRVAGHRPDIQYQVLDLAAIMRHTPETLLPMLRQLADEVDTGKLPPLPVRAFQASQVVPALRYMQQGRHTGKIVLQMPAWAPGDEASDGNGLGAGSWLITGGLGGLGLTLAQWLVECGARELILLGRHPPQEAQQTAIDRLTSRGVRVLVELCDVANEQDLAGVFARSARQLSPLRGVFHLAGILDDAPLRQLDWPRFANVYGPKVLGAWNLHRLTRDLKLDCFVLFSSWTTLVGSPGQANHASANAFLDALAHYRRGRGLPAQSNNWGGWRETGSAARPERLAHLARQGMGSISSAEGLAALARVMRSDSIQVGISPFDVARWRASNPAGSAARLTSGLPTIELPQDGFAGAEQTETGAPLPLREVLRQSLPGSARREAIEGCIQRRVARVLQMPSAKFDVRKSFQNLGLDSLTSLELRNHLEVDAGIKLPASLVYNHTTIAALALELGARMGVPLDTCSPTLGESDPPGAPQDDELTELLGALRELPPEEALQLLMPDVIQGGNR